MTGPTRYRWPIKRIVLAIAVAVIVAIGVTQRDRFDLAALQGFRATWQDWSAAHLPLAAGGFFAAYVAMAALSVPVGGAMTLLAGALFGVVLGTLLASFASVIGATLAMLIARYLLRDIVRRRFADRLKTVEGGGAGALLSLRLLPVVPFFVVNLAMGLTTMPALTFALVSQAGMLPATLLYANAGRQIETIRSLQDILTPRILAGFLALAALPLLVRAGQAWWRGRARRKRWPRPPRTDYNLIVVGAGSAGLVAAHVAAAAGARVALVERGRMGGDCLNTGCVPSKALIRSAKLAHEGRRPERLGLTGRLGPDFPAVMARLHRVVARIAPHDSVARYRSLGVEVIEAEARVTGPWTVEAGGRVLTGRRIVIATGAAPTLPPIPGLAEVTPLTSETLWSLDRLPARLLVVGGGAIGCELAQAFARLGSRVTLVEAGEALLGREDVEASLAAVALLRGEGVDVRLGTTIQQLDRPDQQGIARLDVGEAIAFDRVLVAVGRTPRTAGLGLEDLGLLDGGRLVVDARLRTRIPSIYAAGDVIGALQFTHAASHYAWVAAMNALFGGFKAWRARPKVFPRVVYTDPEIASVGLTATEAATAGVAVEVTRFDLADLDRAIVDGAAEGFVKVLTARGSDRLVGVTIVGARAGDILAEFTLAMTHGLGLAAVLATIHPYPGWTDAARSVAGAWRRAHLPARLVALSRRYLAWRRG